MYKVTFETQQKCNVSKKRQTNKSVKRKIAQAITQMIIEETNHEKHQDQDSEIEDLTLKGEKMTCDNSKGDST